MGNSAVSPVPAHVFRMLSGLVSLVWPFCPVIHTVSTGAPSVGNASRASVLNHLASSAVWSSTVLALGMSAVALTIPVFDAIEDRHCIKPTVRAPLGPLTVLAAGALAGIRAVVVPGRWVLPVSTLTSIVTSTVSTVAASLCNLYLV